MLKKTILILLSLALVLSLCACGADTKADDPVPTEEISEASEEPSVEIPRTIYHVGDSIQDGAIKVVYAASGEHIEENELIQPSAGYKIVYFSFILENTSEDTVDSISLYDFTCFADGVLVAPHYPDASSLTVTLAPGRAAVKNAYFLIPETSSTIELEYTTDVITTEQVVFLYEGELDSEYEAEVNAEPYADAYAKEAVAEIGDIQITYVDWDENEGDGEYFFPQDDYIFVTCEFEIQNNGEDAGYMTSYDFACYADGYNCEQKFFERDDLAADLTAGAVATGTVTFEVPEDADVVEVELVSQAWTSDRVVFSVWAD